MCLAKLPEGYTFRPRFETRIRMLDTSTELDFAEMASASLSTQHNTGMIGAEPYGEMKDVGVSSTADFT